MSALLCALALGFIAAFPLVTGLLGFVGMWLYLSWREKRRNRHD